MQTDTLGSPPLLQLLKKVQPAYWFSAHLHVKFAAIFKHGLSGADAREAARAPGHGGKIPPQQGPPVNPDEINIDSDDDDDDTAAAPNGAGLQHVANPDEIDIDSEDDEEGAKPVNGLMAPATAANPDEIDIDDEDDDVTDGDVDMRPRASGAAEQSDRPIPNESAAAAEAVKDLKVDESVDLVGQARQVDSSAASGVIGAPASIPARANGEMPAVQAESSDTPQAPSDRTGDKQTRFLALDKCGQGKEFIQVHVSSTFTVASIPLWLTISFNRSRGYTGLCCTDYPVPRHSRSIRFHTPTPNPSIIHIRYPMASHHSCTPPLSLTRHSPKTLADARTPGNAGPGWNGQNRK